MNELIIDNQTIQDKIYTIRGVQVMVDRDLAELYNVETRALKQAVKRNIERFPEEDSYETVAGFMMYMLKSIPKKAATLVFEGYTFEVVDVDNFKVDQLLVTKH